MGETQSKESLQRFQLPVTDASSLNQSVRNQPNERQEDLFHLTLLDWTERRVQTGTRPDCFGEFARQGWPIKDDTPGIRITLYQAWCLFLQDKIKHNEQVFRILTIDWLASIDSRLKAVSFSRDDLIAVVQGPLGEQRELLIGLHDDVARLLKDVGGLALTLGELLPLVIEFRNEVGEHFQALRSELVTIRDQLGRIEETTTRSDQKLDQVLNKLDRSAVAAPSSPPRAPHQLPPSATAGTLYGRVKQCRELDAALRARKSVSVLGPAGYGKTALAAKAVEAVAGKTPESLATGPYPDGVLFLNLYAYRGQADSVWSALADVLAGDDVRQTELARVRATKACRGKQILVIIEGGEEADGKEGRVTLAELLSVLSAENCSLLLTRDKSQTQAGTTISVDEPLSDLHAGQLFDKLTRKRVQGPIRERVLKLLHGHPLALTWAGGLLAREDENPNVLADEWEADPTRTLSDPMQSTQTLQWLFGRSVRGLDDTARQALDAAGLLAQVVFPDEAIDAAVGWTPSSVLLGGVISTKPDGRGRPSYVRSALKQLIDRGLLRRDQERPAWCGFTHDLGYQFARDESASDVGLRTGLAAWLHQRLSAALSVGADSTDELADLLRHAAALLRTDHDQQLWRPLANFLLYEGEDRLVSLGRLDWRSSAIEAVKDWLDRFPDEKADEPEWLRERSVVFNQLGDLATAQGNLPEAQRLFGEQLRIAQRLAESDPANAAWQRDLVVSHHKLAMFAQQSGDEAGCVNELRECYLILHRMKQLQQHLDPPVEQLYQQLADDFGGK